MRDFVEFKALFHVVITLLIFFALSFFSRIDYSTALRKISSFLIITWPLLNACGYRWHWVAERNQFASDVVVEALHD